MSRDMIQEHVVLVNEVNEEIGTMEKMAAHLEGALHRAFSVFVFNTEGELLLQRRALHKYHSGGLWTNTCCSHPRLGEELDAAVHRRLMEEMGFDCEVRHVFSFLYHQKVGTLIEHELDHVFVGQFDGKPEINLEEVDSWKWVKMEDLLADMKQYPENYTVWFRLCIDLVEEQRKAGFENTSGEDEPIKYIA